MIRNQSPTKVAINAINAINSINAINAIHRNRSCVTNFQTPGLASNHLTITHCYTITHY